MSSQNPHWRAAGAERPYPLPLEELGALADRTLVLLFQRRNRGERPSDGAHCSSI